MEREGTLGTWYRGGGCSPDRATRGIVVEIWPSCVEVGKRAADLVQCELSERAHPVLAVPTGTTPIHMYRELVERLAQGQLRLEHAKFFSLDEFVGLEPGQPGSFSRYMQDCFWGPARLRESQRDIPRGWVEDLAGECVRYEEEIAKAGGIDLAVVGVGVNGHVAFNEPGSDPSLGTRVVELSEVTRRAQALWFGGLVGRVPRRAVTVGMRTIMAARRIVLLACGRHKAKVVYKMLLEPPSEQLPASLLRLHPDLTVLLDEEAAYLLWPKEFRVGPRGAGVG